MTEQTKNDRIFLQLCDDEDSEWCGDVTWCQDRVHEDDVEYIRADIVAEQLAAKDKEIQDHHFSWAGCSQQLKDVCTDLDETENRLSIISSALQIALDAINQIYKNGTQSCRNAADIAFKAINKELGK